MRSWHLTVSDETSTRRLIFTDYDEAVRVCNNAVACGFTCTLDEVVPATVGR